MGFLYRLGLFLCLLSLFACSGPSKASRGFDTLPLVVPPQQAQTLWSDAQEVIESRCTVCHGCYDAPCQLKLDAHEGVRRGASTVKVYEPSRLLAAEPSRLFIDETSVAGWRGRDFYPVLPEGEQLNPYESVLMRMLGLKRAHPLPQGLGVSPDNFDLGINREQVCPKQDAMDEYAKAHPHWGMPYALPGLTPQEEARIVAWVSAGAPSPEVLALSDAAVLEMSHWEAFLNRKDKRSQLVARYIFEHLFFASLYFPDVDETTFFRLIRSSTPPGVEPAEIATRRPFDSPGRDTFYYRLIRRPEMRLAKQQMPYPLSAKRLERFEELFFGRDWQVERLPSYAPEVAANPFKAFLPIPVVARYRFMLEEAEYTMMGFIKGPVCHGQTALNVIQDRFWIAFVDPDQAWVEREASFLARAKDLLDMPAEDGSDSALLGWFSLAQKQRAFQRAKRKFLKEQIKAGTPQNLQTLWDGDGHNDNATLTVFRHFDSATVEKGLLGEHPKTAWVVGYSLLERIHYLLVAGFDVFGNVGHQLSTRMYMDFLRMEGEHNFLLLLPNQRRRQLVDTWYRHVDADVKEQVYGALTEIPFEPDMEYSTDKPEHELYEKWRTFFAPLSSTSHDLSKIQDDVLREQLGALQRISGPAASHMPESSFISIETAAGETVHVTLTRDSAHTNVAELFDESSRRRPAEDRLTLSFGFIGSYPNALFRLKANQVPELVTSVEGLDSHLAYLNLRKNFGVLRNSPDFWHHSDAIHEAYYSLDRLGSGLFDYNRLDPR